MGSLLFVQFAQVQHVVASNKYFSQNSVGVAILYLLCICQLSG